MYLCVYLRQSPVKTFFSGLNTAYSYSGVIEELNFEGCGCINVSEFRSLHTLSPLIAFSECIPSMLKLKILCLTDMDHIEKDGMLSNN